MENRKTDGSLAIHVRIPWKTAKLQSLHSMLGLYRPASETAFKWRFAGGPMIAGFKWHFNWILSHLISQNRFGPPLTKLYRSTPENCSYRVSVLDHIYTFYILYQARQYTVQTWQYTVSSLGIYCTKPGNILYQTWQSIKHLIFKI